LPPPSKQNGPRSLRALKPVEREPDERTSPFVGRKRELAEVRSALADARAGRGRLVLLTGEPGIGKTWLADESARLAAATGMRVRWGRCWEGSGAPAHWPWIQVIRAVIRESDAAAVRSRNLSADIARILPELSSDASEPKTHVDAEQARFRLFDAVATLLRESAREQPVVIVLDDLHEADTASLQMLQFVARVLHDANVLIIGTYRDAEMRRSTERSLLMDEIVRDALVLPIAALTESEVGDLVAGRATGAPAIGIVAELYRATAGNPLFVDGVLRTLAAEGRLGSGARIDLAGFKLPDSVRGAIRRRLSQLSADARAVLTTAAVIGQEPEHELVAQVHGYTEEKLAALMGEAEEMGIVGVAGASASRFTHPLLREALYDDLEARERTRLHRQVAAALESLYGPNLTPRLAELAHHWRAGARAPEDIEKAIDYAIRAGDAASAVFAYEGAIEHFRVAVELAGKQDSNLLRRAELLFRLGAVTTHVDCIDSIDFFENALAVYEQLGLAEGAARCHASLAAVLSLIGPPRLGLRDVRWISDPTRAGDHLRHAEALVAKGGDTPSLAQFYCGIALNSFVRLRINEGLHAGQRAMEIADRLHRSDLWAAAASAHAWNLMFSGRLGEAVALAESAWQIADREGDEGGAFAATYAGIAFCFGLHDFKEAMRWAQRELGKPRTAQSPFRRESIAQLMSNNTARLGDLTEARRLSPHSDRRFFRASLLLFEGQWEEAEDLFESEIVESRSIGNLVEVSNCNSILAILLRVRGAAQQAALALAEAVTEIGEANVRSEMQMRPALSRAHVELGQYDAAEPELARCREIVAAGEDWRGMSGDVGLAAAVLAAARGRYQEAEGEFAAALSIFCRYSAPWEEADTLECWGSALVAAGDRARAAEKFDAAIQVYRRIGAPERWIERVTSMRERAVAVTGSEDPTSASEIGRRPASATLRRNGEYWLVSDGGTTAHLKDMKGLHHISQLLRHPGEELHVLDLIGRDMEAGEQRTGWNPGPSVGLPVLDAEARSAYRRRLGELREELAEAETFNDIGRAEQARAEIDALTAQLSTALGLGGRGRVTGGAAERARSTVTHAINAALRSIRRSLPALADDLALRLTTGTFCVYKPDPAHPTDWIV
jgi:tetratricopeptide (TPR) repeat protein/nucleoside-triphosphatase THEP1